MTFTVFGASMQESLEHISRFLDVPAPLSSTKHIYEGLRTGGGQNCSVIVDGQPLTASDQAWEWGYLGSRPLVPARALLEREYGVEIAEKYATWFMRDVIAALPRKRGDVEWTLDSTQMHLWFRVVRMLEQIGASNA